MAKESDGKESQRVFVCALGRLLKWDKTVVKPKEQTRRCRLMQSILRYATDEIGKINVLTNLFTTMHINYMIRRQEETAMKTQPEYISDCIATDLYFRNAITYVTTEKGRRKLPLFKNNSTTKQDQKREANMRSGGRTTEEIEAFRVKRKEKRDKEQREKNQLELSFKHVFDKEFFPLLPKGFTFPKRDYLGEMLNDQCSKRVTNLKTYYQTTLLPRQKKVLKDLANTHLQSLLDQKIITKQQKNSLVNVVLMTLLSEINNWTCDSKLLSSNLVLSIVFDMCIRDWVDQTVDEHRLYLYHVGPEH